MSEQTGRHPSAIRREEMLAATELITNSEGWVKSKERTLMLLELHFPEHISILVN
jgi:hypothetical protein